MIVVILGILIGLITLFFIGLFTHLVGRTYEWIKRKVKGENLS